MTYRVTNTICTTVERQWRQIKCRVIAREREILSIDIGKGCCWERRVKDDDATNALRRRERERSADRENRCLQSIFAGCARARARAHAVWLFLVVRMMIFKVVLGNGRSCCVSFSGGWQGVRVIVRTTGQFPLIYGEQTHGESQGCERHAHLSTTHGWVARLDSMTRRRKRSINVSVAKRPASFRHQSRSFEVGNDDDCKRTGRRELAAAEIHG